MIKKILSILLLFITSLTLFTNVNKVYAAEVNDTGINGVWHVTDGNRAYIHKRLTIEDYSNYDSMTSSGYVISPENKITETIVSDVDHYLNFDTRHIKYLNGPSVNSQIANPDPS